MTAAQPSMSAAMVPVDRLVFHPRNVRRQLGDLRELAASIAQVGVLQPLVVERRPGAEVLRVLAGHRRLQASRLAGLKKVAEVAQLLGVSTATVYAWLRQTEESEPQPAAEPATAPPAARTPRPRRGPSGRVVHPRVRPSAIASMVDEWRPRAVEGLDAAAAAELLDQLDALLGGWRPTPGAVSVRDGVLASVAELDPKHRRPVKELAERLDVHPKLVERARCALRREGEAPG